MDTLQGALLAQRENTTQLQGGTFAVLALPANLQTTPQLKPTARIATRATYLQNGEPLIADSAQTDTSWTLLAAFFAKNAPLARGHLQTSQQRNVPHALQTELPPLLHPIIAPIAPPVQYRTQTNLDAPFALPEQRLIVLRKFA